MHIGADFFKILNLVVVIMRLIAEMFGDDEAKTAAAESKERTSNSDPNEAC